MLTEKQKQVIAANPSKVAYHNGGVGGGTFVFQPGDGTRYVVTVRQLSDAECKVHGCAVGSRMFSIMRGSNVFVALCSDGVPHSSYLMEKLGLRPYDADAWEGLLDFVVNSEDFTALHWEG